MDPATLTGLELMQAMLDGKIPPPSIAITIPMQGVAVESGSVGQLQAAIMSLATDPESARRMGAESRARVVAQFDQVDVRARFVDYVTGLQR